MTKPKKTSWDICEKCISRSEFYYLKERALTYILNHKENVWHNPREAVRFCFGNYARKLCSNCSFVLEHATASHELQTKLKTRWDVCECCAKNSTHVFRGWLTEELKVKAQSIIERDKMKHWRNPRNWALFDMDELEKKGHLPVMLKVVTKVCEDCPFVFEHEILDQELKHD